MSYFFVDKYNENEQSPLHDRVARRQFWLNDALRRCRGSERRLTRKRRATCELQRPSRTGTLKRLLAFTFKTYYVPLRAITETVSKMPVKDPHVRPPPLMLDSAHVEGKQRASRRMAMLPTRDYRPKSMPMSTHEPFATLDLRWYPRPTHVRVMFAKLTGQTPLIAPRLFFLKDRGWARP